MPTLDGPAAGASVDSLPPFRWRSSQPDGEVNAVSYWSVGAGPARVPEDRSMPVSVEYHHHDSKTRPGSLMPVATSHAAAPGPVVSGAATANEPDRVWAPVVVHAPGTEVCSAPTEAKVGLVAFAGMFVSGLFVSQAYSVSWAFFVAFLAVLVKRSPMSVHPQ